MGVSVGIGLIALTGYTMYEQEKRADRVEEAQKREREVASATRAHESRKARREQIREARVRQAQIENTAAVAGQTGSSAAVAAGDSMTARLGTNLGDINTALATSDAKSDAAQGVLDANRKSDMELAGQFGISAANTYLKMG